MGTRNQLAIGGDQVLGARSISWISEVAAVQLGAGKADVIDAFKQYDMSDARDRQSIPVEPSQSADGKAASVRNEAVAQQPVADYAFVDHCYLRPFVHLFQTTDEIARPVVVCIYGRSIAISDRVAEGHYETLRRMRRNEHCTDQD